MGKDWWRHLVQAGLEALAQAYSLKEASLAKKTVGRLEISWDYLKEGELKDKKER